MPTVSVIIPTYNRIESLGRLLNTINLQTFPPDEIVIVNDDVNTPITLNQFLSKIHIRIINNAKNMGPNRSRVIGLNYVTSDYILFVDDDNLLSVNTLEKLVHTLLDNEDKMGAIAPVAYYQSNTDKIWWCGTKLNKLTFLVHFNKCQTKQNLIETNDVHNCWLMPHKYSFVLKDASGLFKRTYPTIATCFELYRMGKKQYVQMDAKVFHDVPQTRSSSSISNIKLLYEEGRLDNDRLFHFLFEAIIFIKKYSEIPNGIYSLFFQILRFIGTSYSIFLSKSTINRKFLSILILIMALLKGMSSNSLTRDR